MADKGKARMQRHRGSLRIVGGEWRSRLVKFVDDGSIRPTPDRVRQTVFDWLAPVIGNMRCLDLFAGSGALGFEALSRGAAHVTFVERNPAQASLIGSTKIELNAGDRADVVHGDALCWLGGNVRERFDLIFVDPPYGSGLLAPVLESLPVVMHVGSCLFVEWPTREQPAMGKNYSVFREKTAGRVSYALLVWSGTERGYP